jgi:hypothetical protein
MFRHRVRFIFHTVLTYFKQFVLSPVVVITVRKIEMSNPVSETKIELVTESIEALVLATVVAATAADKDHALNHQNVLDARETLKGSLRQFLAPSLRVVASEGQRFLPPENVPYGGKGVEGMNLA